MTILLNGLAYLARRIIRIANALGRVGILLRKTFYWLLHYRWEWPLISRQMYEIGVRSFPVTTLTNLFTGMVLALQSGYSFRNIFNEPLYVGTVVAFSMFKELGPVLTAVVVAGRVGAAIAAEIGTMQVTEQIDALYTLGTNPVRYLFIPRFLAFLVMLPVLTVFADAIGVIGGFIVSVTKLHIPSTVYWDDVLNYLEISDMMHGLIKSFFFALIIVVVACYKGFTTSGGAEGVGRATTSAVVVAMVLVLVGDYFLTALLVAFGIG